MCDQDEVEIPRLLLRLDQSKCGPQGQMGHRKDSFPLQGLHPVVVLRLRRY